MLSKKIKIQNVQVEDEDNITFEPQGHGIFDVWQYIPSAKLHCFTATIRASGNPRRKLLLYIFAKKRAWEDIQQKQFEIDEAKFDDELSFCEEA